MAKQGSESFEMFQRVARVAVHAVNIDSMADSIVRQAGGDQRKACAVLDDLQAAVNRRLRGEREVPGRG